MYSCSLWPIYFSLYIIVHSSPLFLINANQKSTNLWVHMIHHNGVVTPSQITMCFSYMWSTLVIGSGAFWSAPQLCLSALLISHTLPHLQCLSNSSRKCLCECNSVCVRAHTANQIVARSESWIRLMKPPGLGRHHTLNHISSYRLCSLNPSPCHLRDDWVPVCLCVCVTQQVLHWAPFCHCRLCWCWERCR